MMRRHVIALLAPFRLRGSLGRTAVAAAVAIAMALVCSSDSFAQQQPAKKDEKKDEKKRSKQEQQEIDQLVKLIDGVMAGEPAPGDIQMTLTPYFLKSQEQRTFVPFALTISGVPPTDAAMYVRVVAPTAAGNTTTTSGQPATPPPAPKKGERVQYAWDDIHFVPAAQLNGGNVRLNRVFMATPGTYDVYVAMKERLPEKAPKNAVAKMGVLKTQVTVPDFWSGELSTSSIIVTDKVNAVTAAPSADEMRERPFVFGAQELIPAADGTFLKTEMLATFFQVYNASLDSSGKPNLVMEYNFHRKEGGAEKFFNKTNPQNINASNLPPTFDPAKFPVPGGIEVPLGTFPEGDYRLEIKITDKNSGKTVTRDVNFSVKAS